MSGGIWLSRWGFGRWRHAGGLGSRFALAGRGGVVASVLLGVLLAVLLMGPAVAAADWSGFRGGGGRNLQAPLYPGAEVGVLWTSAVKSSHAPECVVAASGRVFAIATSPDTGQMRLYAVSALTGAVLWSQPVSYQRGIDDNGCPATDGTRVYTTAHHNGSWGPSAFDAATGARVWQSTIFDTAGRAEGSPVVAAGKVFLGAWHHGSHCGDECLYALDGQSGGLVWAKAGGAWELPPLVAGSTILHSTAYRSDADLRAYGQATGETMWTAPTDVWRAVADGTTVFTISGSVLTARDVATGAVQWTASAPVFNHEIEAVVADSQRVYFETVSSGASSRRLVALDRATGSLLWNIQRTQDYSPLWKLGNLVLSSGNAYNGATGALVHAPSEFTDTKTPWMNRNSPAYVDGTFFVFDEDYAAGEYTLKAVRDIKPPILALAQPAAGSASSSERPVFSWSVSDGLGTGVESIRVHLNGTQVADMSSGTSWQPATALAEGNYTWQVRARDRVGNLTTSPTRSLTIDRTAPSVFELVAPVAGAVVSEAHPTLRWRPAGDSLSGVYSYRIAVGAQQAFTVTPQVCGADICSAVSPHVVPDGSHGWSVTAIDRAGNERAITRAAFSVQVPPIAAVVARPASVLTGTQIGLDASGSLDPNGSIVRYEWDLDADGAFERDTGGAPTTSALYDTPGKRNVRVRVTDRAGLTAQATIAVDVSLAPPSGEVGVSINGGAIATSDPNVTLHVVWPPFTKSLLVSNDGGFSPASTPAIAGRVPWKLQESGSERLPKTVYVRFRGEFAGRETYTDDIILDQTAPVIQTAQIEAAASASASAEAPGVRNARATRRLRLRAKDNASGINGYQVTPRKAKPGKLIKLQRRRKIATTVKLKLKAPRLYVRVRDAAGNHSSWRTARRY
jgi:hypothetical protein